MTAYRLVRHCVMMFVNKGWHLLTQPLPNTADQLDDSPHRHLQINGFAKESANAHVDRQIHSAPRNCMQMLGALHVKVLRLQCVLGRPKQLRIQSTMTTAF